MRLRHSTPPRRFVKYKKGDVIRKMKPIFVDRLDKLTKYIDNIKSDIRDFIHSVHSELSNGQHKVHYELFHNVQHLTLDIIIKLNIDNVASNYKVITVVYIII
jgi:hypothetical protein